MTYQELLKRIEWYMVYTADSYTQVGYTALRSIMELHKPQEDIYLGNGMICPECTGEEITQKYPCPTIYLIEKELSVKE